MERYDGKLRHVFKQLPLDMHQQAKMAAEAGLCANDQGKFWELHDWMFQNQSKISREAVEATMAELGADMEEFKACLDEHRHLPNVMANLGEARSLGFSGTPAFLVNGRAITGAQPLENFVRLIDEELEKKGITPPEPKAPAAPAS
jgi:protein-disulfide isomerase